MKISKSVRKALVEWEQDDLESAMLHACNAVDGTAKLVYPETRSNTRFTALIRNNYSIFGPMAAPGIDVAATRFPVRVEKPKASGGAPDIADVVYGIHRCTHGHGDELPGGFELIGGDVASGETTMRIANGTAQLSERVIFGLIAIVMAQEVNKDQFIGQPCWLSFDNGKYKFVIDEWWGRKADLLSVIDKVKLPLVKLDFGDWMETL